MYKGHHFWEMTIDAAKMNVSRSGPKDNTEKQRSRPADRPDSKELLMRSALVSGRPLELAVGWSLGSVKCASDIIES